MSMTGATGPSGLPSHAAVLEGLRRICFRQVVRYRHEPVVDVLRQLGFVDWGRQPARLSQLPASARAESYQAPVEVAALTATGQAALDWLAALEHSPQWAEIKSLPYGFRRWKRP